MGVRDRLYYFPSYPKPPAGKANSATQGLPIIAVNKVLTSQACRYFSLRDFAALRELPPLTRQVHPRLNAAHDSRVPYLSRGIFHPAMAHGLWQYEQSSWLSMNSAATAAATAVMSTSLPDESIIDISRSTNGPPIG